MEHGKPKPVVWIGSSLRDLRDFPEDVKDEAGHALYVAQCGDMHESAKPLRGYGGAGVQEVRLDDRAGTFRVVYTVQFRKALYVLHAFQKKSKQGSVTPQSDLDLIDRRLAVAREHYAKHFPEHDKETHDDE